MLSEYPELLTVKHLAGILGVHANTVRNLMNKGELQSIKFGNKLYMPKAWFIEYMESKR